MDAPVTCGDETRCRVEMPPPSFERQTSGDIIPHVEGGHYTHASGEPNLPVFVRVVPVPFHCEAEIKVVSLQSHETNAVQIGAVDGAVAQEDAAGHRVVVPVASVRSSIYDVDAWWPTEPLEIGYATQGTQRWARIVFHPFQYNPVQHLLRWNESLEARLTWNSTLADEAAK